MEKSAGTLALYLRISREDETPGESDSVKNQRDLLYSYLQTHPALQAYTVIEVVDDGYSGTGFDRPGMNRLLEQIRLGEIACVMVKDFSRFGRNYIETGNYLEQIFPFLGVRFISVNDRFDSGEQGAAGGGLGMAFQNLIHDLYSRDLSQKIKSARGMKMRMGEYTSAYALFGYEKSPTEKGRLCATEPAAEIVRKIFRMAGTGQSTTQIARQLNGENCPTPLAYRQPGRETFWTKDSVTRILREERYTGKMVCGKRQRLLGEKSSRKRPRLEWVEVADTHEALVSQAEFQQAQACMAAFHERDPSSRQTSAGGVLHCGHCGYTLRRKDCAQPYVYCVTGRYIHAPACDGVRISADTVMQGMLTAAQMLGKLTVDTEKLQAVRETQSREYAAATAREITRLIKAAETLRGSKSSLYETYREGKLTKEVYRNRLEQAANRCAVIEKQVEQLKAPPDIVPASICKQDLLRELIGEAGMTLVERVDIYDSTRMELQFSFGSPFSTIQTNTVEK